MDTDPTLGTLGCVNDENAPPSLLEPQYALTPKTPGAASLAIQEAEATDDDTRRSLARARALRADAMLEAAQRILDAPIPGSGSPSAEQARARDRAALLERRAKYLARETYGDALKLDAKVAVQVAFPLSLLLPTGAEPPPALGAGVDDVRVVTAHQVAAESRAALPPLRESQTQ